MSPEPIQPHSAKQSWDNPNLSIDIAFDDTNLQLSDNDDEYIDSSGYLPLTQDPTDSDSISSNDNDEDDKNIDDESQCTILSTTNANLLQPPLQTLESQSSNSYSTSRIHLDSDKIDQVKSIMANIKLPTHTYPPWASAISEDQWKKQLIDKIKHINDS